MLGCHGIGCPHSPTCARVGKIPRYPKLPIDRVGCSKFVEKSLTSSDE